MLRQIALWIIFSRATADTIGLLLPGTLEFVKKNGWPIDKFWVGSIWPVTFTMTIFSIHALLGYRTESYFGLLLSVVPFSWAIVMLKHKGNTWLMKFDAATWILVSICTLYVLK